jgi:hypothetical protein
MEHFKIKTSFSTAKLSHSTYRTFSNMISKLTSRILILTTTISSSLEGPLHLHPLPGSILILICFSSTARLLRLIMDSIITNPPIITLLTSRTLVLDLSCQMDSTAAGVEVPKKEKSSHWADQVEAMRKLRVQETERMGKREGSTIRRKSSIRRRFQTRTSR